MPKLNLFILYVQDMPASAAFYQDLLGRAPQAAFPTWTAFDLGGGFTLGLWSVTSVAPPPSPTGHRSELAFMLESPAAVESLWSEWRARGIPIAQPLTQAVFGPTFTLLDPDGHRVRVCPADR